MNKCLYIIGVVLLSAWTVPSFAQVSNDNEDRVNKIDTRFASQDFVPDQVLVKFKDAETGREKWVDTSSRAWHDAYRKMITNESLALNRLFTMQGIDNTLIYTDEDYVKPLMQLFKKRESRR